MIRCWDRADFMPNFIIHSFNNVSADESRRRHVACLRLLSGIEGRQDGWGSDVIKNYKKIQKILKNY